MKYYLIAYSNELNYEIITGYSKLPGFESLDETSLEDIVKFTSMFDSYEDLITFLIENNLLKKDMNITIKILRKDEKEKISISKEKLSFKSDSDLFNQFTLIKKYYDLANNINFIKRFLDTFYDKLISYPNIDIQSLKYCYDKSIRDNKKVSSINILLAGIIDDIIHNTKDKDKKFEVIRCFAMFVINFERSYTNNLASETNNKELIRHYKELLESDDITDEQREIYESELKRLEREENDVAVLRRTNERKWKKNNGNKDWC